MPARSAALSCRGPPVVERPQAVGRFL